MKSLSNDYSNDFDNEKMIDEEFFNDLCSHENINVFQ